MVYSWEQVNPSPSASVSPQPAAPTGCRLAPMPASSAARATALTVRRARVVRRDWDRNMAVAVMIVLPLGVAGASRTSRSLTPSCARQSPCAVTGLTGNVFVVWQGEDVRHASDTGGRVVGTEGPGDRDRNRDRRDGPVVGATPRGDTPVGIRAGTA